ncbi:maltotransferase domain-containing protein [Anthocerotibacter panamensis]|uniref:maltotransferase domain-containing protein n=1 Tax=Anthocerotibacter panamensis TaxID=2857077 RepID=UPI001C4047A5|nr:maltotransferase domain-containing protein [Anthocerotibacter panamensis]
MQSNDRRRRVLTEGLAPKLDGRRFTIKGTSTKKVAIETGLFVNGYDKLAARMGWPYKSNRPWEQVSLSGLINDRWQKALSPNWSALMTRYLTPTQASL